MELSFKGKKADDFFKHQNNIQYVWTQLNALKLLSFFSFSGQGLLIFFKFISYSADISIKLIKSVVQKNDLFKSDYDS